MHSDVPEILSLLDVLVIAHRSIGQTVAGYQDLVTGIYTAKAARRAKRRPAEEPVGVA